MDARGSYGNNFLNGGVGNDTLYADNTSGKNLLDGGDGDDYLSATGSNFSFQGSIHILNGGAGNDILNVKSALAKNTLIGGTGDDVLIGGTNQDTFVFNSYNEGLDSIYDFDNNNELIQISATGFGGGLTLGSLSASQFTLGIAATTSDQRFIYNNTGALYFDQDGSDSGFTQVQFAQLYDVSSLSATNFVVV